MFASDYRFLAALVLQAIIGVQAGPLGAAPLSCPDSPFSQESIEAWRAEAAAGLEAGSLAAPSITKGLKDCFSPQIPQCLQRLADYAARNDIARSEDDPKINYTPQKQPPRQLLAPGSRAFEYVLPENIEDLAAANDWPAVRYKSRHSGGFDTETPSLLMVYVAGDKVQPPVSYDRWLNFALPADTGFEALLPSPMAPVPSNADYAAELAGNERMPRTFTMITLDKAQNAQAAKIYFQKFYRSSLGRPTFIPEANSDMRACVNCHPNGLRAISPLGYHVRAGETQLAVEDWKNVELINRAMNQAAGYRPVSWREVTTASGQKKSLLKPSAHGPWVGPLVPLNNSSRSKEFILGGRLSDGSVLSGCYNSRTTVDVRDIFNRAPGANNVYKLSAAPTIRWEKVRDAMKCAACHGGQMRAPINRLTQWDQIDFKILVDRSMPQGMQQNPLDPGNPDGLARDALTLDERIALSNCLKEEFALEQQHLAKWLTQPKCE